MSYVVETSSDTQRILVVEKTSHRFTTVLKEYAKQKETELMIAQQLPARPDSFAMSFLINSRIPPTELPEYTSTPLIYVVIGNKKRAHALAKKAHTLATRNIKIISLPRDDADNNTIEQLIWFAYSHEHDSVLFEVVLSRTTPVAEPFTSRFIRPFRRSKRRIALAVLALWFLCMGVIIGTLYGAARMRLARVTGQDVRYAEVAYSTAIALYRPVRPLFFLFSLGLTADSLVNTNDAITSLRTQQQRLNLQLSQLIHGTLLAQSASQSSVKSAQTELTQTISYIDTLLNQPEWILGTASTILSNLNDTKVQLQRYARITETIPGVFGADSRRTYAVIVANNRQLTTGGGLVQAVILVRVQGGHIVSLQTYPAAVLDQTLATTLPAPESMRTYANRSFLNTQTALTEPQLDGNAQTIQTLLANEREVSDIDGYLYVTDTALAQILGEGSIYLPTTHEKLSADSLPIKLAAAGSNEAFYEEFTTAMLHYMASRQADKLLPTLDRLFMEKHLAFLTAGPGQETFADLYWDGQLIPTRCVVDSQNCVVDLLGIYQTGITPDYNTLLVKQTRSLKTTISDDGVIRNQLNITLTNDPQQIAYPPSTYDTYIQLILPRNSVVESATDNAQPIENVLSRQAGYTLIAFPTSIKPQETRYLQITYTLTTKLAQQDGAYQLILQKQLGGASDDFTFELILPKSLAPSEENFHPVVNSNRIFYNNFQSTDRIFVITLKHTK